MQELIDFFITKGLPPKDARELADSHACSIFRQIHESVEDKVLNRIQAGESPTADDIESLMAAAIRNHPYSHIIVFLGAGRSAALGACVSHVYAPTATSILKED